MVRRVPRRDRGGRRPGGGVHAAPPAQLHRRGLQDPHDRERAAANRRRSAARHRRGAAGQCDAAVEGATLGRRAARRAGISEDLLVVLRRHEPARRGAQVREGAGRGAECRGAQSRATVLRLHRVPQVSWRSGRGDGPSAPTLKDDAGFPIFAADLHQSWRFRGGATSADIYRRLRTGLDGTPMPSFSDLIDQKFLTDEQLWRLAQYVRSLSPARTPEVRDVIHAPRLAAALPAAPGDSVWDRVDRYWLPLVGQVIRKPRWFGPAVCGVRGRAA